MELGRSTFEFLFVLATGLATRLVNTVLFVPSAREQMQAMNKIPTASDSILFILNDLSAFFSCHN